MTQRDNRLNFETILTHGDRGNRNNIAGTPTVCPIYTSTTYMYDSMEALDKAFDGTTPAGEEAFVYARHSNPNTSGLADIMTQIEGGVGTVVFSSGMAAIHAALLAAGLVSGTKIVASKDIYGPTIELLQQLFVPTGVEVVLGNLCCPEATDFIFAEQPDVIFVETLSNPLVKMVDLEAISTAAREIGAVTIVDSTFTTPYLIRPIEHGFDIVVHSATKYISGHGDSTGGVATCARNSLLDQLRTSSVLLGAMLSPFDSHLMVRGLRTLSLRMERHCSNAMQIAHFLQQHPAVAQVYYPGLPSHPNHALASKILSNERYGGLLAFELKKQSREAVYRFIDNLRIILPATTLGDVFSLVSYPPMSSHRALTDAERRGIGITDGCIRFSAGIEHIDDIIKDLDQALMS